MIYDISMDLNGIPLCVNVYPINLEGNLCQLTDTLNWIPKQPPNKSESHPIQLKRELHSMSIETTVSMYIEWNPTD
jgi:hypothetical protein